MADPVKILWTGGWDSTFRVLQLVDETEYTVEPYYVFDYNRPSARVELQTVYHLRDLFVKNHLHGDPGRLLEPRILNRDQAPDSSYLWQAFRGIQERARLGKQYVWLAALMEKNGLDGVEISITNGHLAHLFRPLLQEDVSSASYRLRESDDPVAILFRPFAFPLIDWTPNETYEYVLEKGWEGAMRGTWFCFSPLFNKWPCGGCTPCVQAIEHDYHAKRVGALGIARYWGVVRVVRLLPAPVRWRWLQILDSYRLWKANQRRRRACEPK